MPTSLRVLIVEDRPDDAELVVLELRRAGFAPDWQRVDTETDFLAALDSKPDIILADYGLPAFTALEVLRWLRERKNDTSCIIVTGSLGDEQAVECIKQGATDYLLKDRLARLGQAVERAMEQKKIRAQQKRTELHKELEYSVTRVLTESTTVQAANQTILQTICKTLEWEWGAIWMVDQSANVLRSMSVWHQPTGAYQEFEAVTRLITFAPGIGVPGRVWADQKPIYIPDITRERNFPRASVAAREGLHAAIAFPVRSQGKIVGVMESFSREAREPENDMFNHLDYLGGLIGQQIERKQAEERLRLTVEAAPMGITIVNSEGTIQLVNEQTEKLFGYTRTEMLGQPIEMLIPARFRQQHEGHRANFFQALSQRAMETGQNLYGLHKNGNEFSVEIGLSPIETADGVQVMASIVDISERKQIQEALQKTHDRLAALVQASPMGITVLSPDGLVQLWNPAAERIYGWRADEVLGRPLPTIPPGKGKEHLSICQQVLGGYSFTGRDLTRQRKDGSLIDISLSTAALRNEQGHVVGILGIMVDITDRKQMERKAARLEELATLGQLLGGVAHELKNPLFILTGRLHLVSEKLATREYDTVGADFKRIEDAAQRMTAVAQRFLSFAQPHSMQRAQCDVNVPLQKTVEFLSNELMKNHIRTAMSLGQDLPPVWCDERELHQVFTNLIMNAAYAMSKANGRGLLTISTALNGATVEIRIQDDGPGITPEHRSKLFNPFFTTKPHNEGTGLGLWIVKTSVINMRGTITCETETGKGATFIIGIPALPAQESS